MKKLLNLVFLSLILNSCASVDKSFYEKQITENGGHVKIHFFISKLDKVETIANNLCKQFNNQNKAENLRLVHQGSIFTWSEMSYWHYDCKK